MSIERFADYVNQAPGLLCIKDTNLVLRACSPQLAKLIGYKTPLDVVGMTDFDMKCDAVQGAEQFIAQDKDALARGENVSINVYTYANGNKVVMYGQKTPLIYKGETLGLNILGYDLTHLNNIATQFFCLVEKDGSFLTINQKRAASYTFHDTFPGSNLTKMESMCLFYIIRGKSNKEIAEILRLSHRTIEGKVTEIKYKMQCDCRNQLIEKALQRGYLEILIKRLLFGNNLSLTIG